MTIDKNKTSSIYDYISEKDLNDEVYKVVSKLKEKYTLVSSDDIPADDLSREHHDAYHALVSLGYHAKSVENSINKIIANNNDLNTESLIKEALRELR